MSQVPAFLSTQYYSTPQHPSRVLLAEISLSFTPTENSQRTKKSQSSQIISSPATKSTPANTRSNPESKGDHSKSRCTRTPHGTTHHYPVCYPSVTQAWGNRNGNGPRQSVITAGISVFCLLFRA